MKFNKLSLILFSIVLITSCASKSWPSNRYILKNKYQEIKGEYIKDGSVPDRYGMYPNGEDGIFNLLAKNVRYPSEAKEKGIKGKVIVRYVVGTNGFVKEIEIKQSIHPLLDTEALRVTKLMERWIPAVENGIFVEVEYYLPINFTLR